MESLFGISIVETEKEIKQVSWVPPLVGWLKINADGSRAEDRFGYGAIVRNHQGECLTVIAARVRAASINILELKGLVHGLQLCSILCASHVWLESDSTTTIASMDSFQGLKNL